MAAKREDHLGENEAQERRSLEHLSRRWPANANVFYVLLVAVLVIILFLAF